MSDLQCAATLLLARHGATSAEGSLSPRGREQAQALALSVRGRRLAVVYTSTSAPAVQTARIVEAGTGVPVVVREDLGDRSGTDLETLADLHRGETVLVVSGAGDERTGCAVTEISIDSDGWTARR
jgi:broad specificity phosphatase PhoE